MSKVFMGVVIGVLLVFLSACAGIWIIGGVLKAPRIEVADVQVSRDCSGFLEVCARVNCLVRNAGGSHGQATLRHVFTSTSGRTWQTFRALSLAPGEQYYFPSDFNGAEWGEGGSGQCEILPAQ